MNSARYTNRRSALLFLASTSMIVFASKSVLAQDCSASRIAELKERCLDILNDIASTIQTGRNLEAAAWNKAQEAIQPSFDCLKGGYDLGVALFKDCNPSSPGVNPVACVETLVGVPDTVEACETALVLVREAKSLFDQAIFIYGAADVAFFDQGGGDIAAELESCGESVCLSAGRSMSEYSRESKERAQRNRDRLDNHEKKLLEVKDKLTRCQEDSGSCVELPEHQFPEMEPVDAGPPGISLN